MAKKKKPTNEYGKELNTKLTVETVNMLKRAFAIGADISAACSFANISRVSYYSWIKENKELEEEFNNLREKPVLKAYQTIAKNLDQPETAKWYLERKRKEFNPKQQIDHTTKGESLKSSLSEEEKSAIEEAREDAAKVYEAKRIKQLTKHNYGKSTKKASTREEVPHYAVPTE